jgi:proline iminopeptidase
LDYPVAIASNPKLMDFEHGADYHATSEYPSSLFVGEYTLVEQLRGMAAIAETFNVLYPQLSHTDFRDDVPRLEVPVYLVAGSHEAAGRETLAREWFDALAAPSKDYLVFDHSGHTPPYDEPGRFADLMNNVVAATEAGSP